MNFEQQMRDFQQGRLPREHPDYEFLASKARQWQMEQEQQQSYQQATASNISPLQDCQSAANSKPEEDKGKEQIDECCICVLDIESDRTVLPCRHVFHAMCIDSWLCVQMGEGRDPLCPMCKRLVFT